MSHEAQTEVGAPIELTEAAAERVRALLKREPNSAARLRVGVKGGGCSGLEYVLKLDANVRPDDLQFEVRGIPLVIDPKSLPYIRGSVLDYTGQLIGGGFRVSNPNASRTCGCGTSFTPSD
ncbi:MAG: hypothetical protein AMXMBFR61_14660 [Fimbriimonadales bacterium]